MMSAPAPGPAAPGSKARPADLPSLDRLLRAPAVRPLLETHARSLVAAEARALLERLRACACAGTLDADAVQVDALAATLAECVAGRLAPRLRAVLNLTGTVIHTNLGRAPLAEAALERIAALMGGPSNLEYDLESGGRGDRDALVESLLCELTGAEAATVVNNNAAAVLLTIAALAAGREVIVSRGELVEIGGAFRMPDVMRSAGARMVEVGTTNRTHPGDYEAAFGPDTGLVMKVHTSNYSVEGFTAAVGEAALAPLCRAHGVPLATDLGSGSLVDLRAWGLPAEPLPRAMLAAGCDVVTFSGDKLLGGPQAGLIVGRRAAIERIRRHPLKRALRVGKLTLAALEATLALYLEPERLAETLPTLRLLTRPVDAIRALAGQLRGPLAAALGPGFAVEAVPLHGQIGSGSLPVERLASAGLAIAATGARRGGRALDALAGVLRGLPTPVIGRIAEGRLLLDLRSLEAPEPFLAQLPRLAAVLGAEAAVATAPAAASAATCGTTLPVRVDPAPVR